MLYRVFENDVGPVQFSAVADENADSAVQACRAVRVDFDDKLREVRLIALPHDRRDLWPNGTTGVVPAEAFKFEG